MTMELMHSAICIRILGVRNIKWYRLLRDQDKKREFRDRVLEEIDVDIEDVQEWWTFNAPILKWHSKENRLLRD